MCCGADRWIPSSLLIAEKGKLSSSPRSSCVLFWEPVNFKLGRGRVGDVVDDDDDEEVEDEDDVDVDVDVDGIDDDSVLDRTIGGGLTVEDVWVNWGGGGGECGGVCLDVCDCDCEDGNVEDSEDDKAEDDTGSAFDMSCV